MAVSFAVLEGKPFDFSNPAKYASAPRIVDASTCYIDGQWVLSGGANISVEDPCTNEVIGEVPKFGQDETYVAIAAAQKAFQSWKDVMPRERGRRIRRWADLMLQYQAAMGNILSRESGKVIAEGVGEIQYAESYVEWYSAEAERVYGDVIPGPRPGVQTTVWKQPIGVVGLVTPWNFPAAMIARAAAGAIAAGCAVVVKPSSLTPFTALAMAQVAEEAGIPAGVFNVITGNSSEISKALMASFDVRKISFTGSTEVGKGLYRQSADTMKKMGLELGGNAPLIVFNDADLARAADGLIAAKFRNAGQTCICCNRAFVQADVYDTFEALVVERVKRMKVGNCFDPTVTTGSLINRSAVERITAVVKDAVEKGATVATGGHPIDGRGYFFEPTVLTHVDHDRMRCCQEELFGPVLPLVKFNTEEEAVAMANATPAGLASYFYSTDYRRQYRVAAALRYGMVGVNDTALSTACAPFGGIKESGLGRDGSKYGIEPFVDIKYVLFSTV